MVSVQLRDRAFADVAADMVEGVLVVNRVADEAAAHLRPVLAEAAEPAVNHPQAA